MSDEHRSEAAAADYEDVTGWGLGADAEEAMLAAQTECTFIWANKEGWPVGVIMSFIWRQGRFWLTASGQRARIAAVRRDPRVCIVVTSTGAAGVPQRQTVTYKGICRLHDDDETKAWFYPDLAAALHPDEEVQRHFARFLDSPRRVIIEVEPTQRISFDGTKQEAATAAWIEDSQ
ncbi:pyridoxamine 5'-phosphate oxidase family protein [Candidatus Poriferisocius sp.]|uniref:pyridoxamine 5'-phosphate oxidase family protein n=1 Tax=Candidatus Poriferisocius sp. TaxID=3101276 RepID=UPI003B012C69